MKALQFHYRPVRYALCKTIGRLFPSLHWHSRLSCLSYIDVPEPRLLGEEWVKIRVKYGGICGSDINLIFLNDSPTTSPFVSFPFTIGHEFIGRVTEVGEKVKSLTPNDRVVVDPVLSCITRGMKEPCPACQRGDFNLCNNKTDGDVSPGLLVGACHDTGGSWSSNLVVHQSQVFKLPDEVDDFNGVMIEPFSCALHSVIRNQPQANETVLVIGAGVIGICVVAAIRALNIPCRIVVLAKHHFQSELATQYGADEVIFLTRGDDYFHDVASSLDARLLKPLFGSPVVQGGADMIFECVGNRRSINDALRFTKSGGKIVILGLTGVLNEIDWTTVWLNELTIKGSFAYGLEEYQGRHRRTHEFAMDLIKEGKVDLSPLITHRFSLEKYKDALTLVTNKSRDAVMKVVFEPTFKEEV